jgi:hypothetical protein
MQQIFIWQVLFTGVNVSEKVFIAAMTEKL